MALGLGTDLAVTIRNFKECPTIAKKVTELLPNIHPVLRDEIQSSYTSLFDWRSGYVVVL